MRGQAKPPLTEIKEVIHDFVKVIQTDNPHQVEIFGEHTRRLSCQFPLQLGDVSARVTEIDDDSAILNLGDLTWEGDEDAHLTQNIYSCAPCEIANQLNKYWLPIWQKDAPLITWNRISLHCYKSLSIFQLIRPLQLI